MDGFQSEEAFLLEACQPVLVYQQGSEVKSVETYVARSLLDCIELGVL